ncbi:MAG TPA: hypothetical protein VG206_20765 [Terriglobia bacterium]|nr:hypothetical protein [Terriglobia bacterium]
MDTNIPHSGSRAISPPGAPPGAAAGLARGPCFARRGAKRLRSAEYTIRAIAKKKITSSKYSRNAPIDS